MNRRPRLGPAQDARSPRRGARALATLALALSATAAGASSCQVFCAAGKCPLRDPPPIAWGQEITDCESRVAGDQPLWLRYFHKGEWRRLQVSEGKQFREAMANFPPDTCGGLSPPCGQARENARTAAKAGRGFDGASAITAKGEPCALALPCGLVLAPAGPWNVRLASPFDGRLRIAGHTAASGEIAVSVAAGRFSLPAGRLVAGATYRYDLYDRDNRAVASGEFTTASPRSSADVEMAMRQGVAEGLPRRLALIDALVDNELHWDARRALESEVTK